MNPIVIILILGIMILLLTPQVRASVIGYNIGRWDELCKKWAQIRGNLKPEEVKAIIMSESSGNEKAVNPSDPSYGLMGVTPLIGKAFAQAGTKEELFVPETNIKAGSGFLSELKTKYAKAYPLTDPKNGWVQMYNTGEPKFLKKGVRSPEYQAKFIRYRDKFKEDFS